MNNGKKSFFKGGLPSKPDVDRLRAKFGTPVEGDIISYEAIAEVVQSSPGTNRFRTVVESWRKLLFRMHSLYLLPTGKGEFKVADSEEKVVWAAGRIASAGRQARKAAVVANSADPAKLSADSFAARQRLVAAQNEGKLALAAKVFGG